MREAFFPSAVQHYAVETARPGDRAAIEAIAARHAPRGARSRAHAARGGRRCRRVPRRPQPARRGRRLHAPVRARRGPAAAARPRPAVRAMAPAPARAPGAGAARGAARPPRARARTGDRAVAVPGRAAARPRARLAGGRPGAAPDLLVRRAARRCSRSSRRSASRGSDCDDVGSAAGGYRRSSATSARSRSPAGCPGSPRATSDVARDRARRGRARAGPRRARIALSKLECDVLRYLRDREGQPVARETLLRDVWGYEWTGGSNVVEVAVSGLRRKLGPGGGAGDGVRRRPPPAPCGAAGLPASLLRDFPRAPLSGRAPQRAGARGGGRLPLVVLLMAVRCSSSLRGAPRGPPLQPPPCGLQRRAAQGADEGAGRRRLCHAHVGLPGGRARPADHDPRRDAPPRRLPSPWRPAAATSARRAVRRSSARGRRTSSCGCPAATGTASAATTAGASPPCS